MMAGKRTLSRFPGAASSGQARPLPDEVYHGQ